MKIKDFIKTISMVQTGLRAMGGGGVLSTLKTLVSGLSGGFDKLAKSIGMSTAALGAFLAAAAVVAAIAGTALYKSQIYDSASTTADEASQAYEQQTQKIEELNSELETTQNRIDELQSKGSLTLVEQEELVNLQTQNALLEQQLETAKAIAEYRKEEARSAASEALNAVGFTLWSDGTGGKNSFISELGKIGMNLSGMNGQAFYDEVDIIDYAVLRQEQLNELTEYRANLIRKQGETDDAKELIEIENEIAKVDKQRAELQGEIASRWDEISEYQAALTDVQGNPLKGFEDTVARIQALQDAIIEYNTSISQKTRTTQDDIDSFLSKPTLKKTVDEVKSAAAEMNGISVDQFKEQFPELATAVEDAGLDIVDVVNTINSAVGALNMDTTADKLKEKLVGLFDVDNMGDASLAHLEERMSAYIEGLSDEEIKILWGIFQTEDTSVWTFEDIQAALENAKSEAARAAEAISEAFTEAFTNVKSEASAVTNALAEQGATGNLSLDTYKELIALSGDYANCLTTENGALQLNAEKAQELTDKKIELEMAQIDLQKALDIEKWKQNAQAIADYESRLDDLTTDEKEKLTTLKETNAQLQDNVNQYNLMKAELQDLTSVYQNWVNAQKLGSSRDMYDSLQTAKKQIEEALKSGETGIGNPLYQAALKLMVPENMQGDVAAYMKKLERYLTEGATGLQNFWDDLIKEGFVIQEDDAQKLVPDATIEAIADRFNLKTEFVESMFHALEMYDGFDFGFGEANVDVDPVTEKLDGVDDRISEIKKDLESLATLEDGEYTAKFGISQDYVDELVGELHELEGQRIEIVADLTGNALETLAEIQVEIDTTKEKLDELSNFDEATGSYTAKIGVDQTEVDQYAQKLDQLQMQRYNLVMSLDTDDVQAKLDELSKQIEEKEAELANLTTTNADGTITLKVDTDQSEYDALSAEIEALKQQKNTIEVATSMNDGADAQPVTDELQKIEDFELHDKQFTVTAIDHSTNVLNGIRNLLASIKSKTVTVTTNHIDNYSSSGGSNSGEADAFGTPSASGGTTLVGELGRELVVSGNRYYTVGDYGAEFVDLKPGDIVFNHEDTEKIFKGLAGVQGRALAYGNAAAVGISGGRSSLERQLTDSTATASISTMNAEAETVELNAENVAYDEVYEGVNYAGWSWADAKAYQEKQRQENTSTLEEMLARRNSPEVREADNLLIRGARYQDEAVTFGGQGRTQSGTDLNGASTLFEHYYNKYQHDLAMGRISKLEYANWLSQAVPAAQRQGQIYDTETVYQYLEEVLSATKEAMEEVRKLKENAIELMQLDLTNSVTQSDYDTARSYLDGIIEKYQNLQDVAHQQAEWFRENGYSDTSDEISELSKLWWEYRDNIIEINTSLYESIIAEHENIIKLNQNMLNQAIENNEYTGVVQYASDIINQYRKMQETIHEQAEYYRSMGYSDTSDEVSELSDLWWDYQKEIESAMDTAWQQITDNAHSALDNIESFYDKLKSAAKEYGESGHITIDTLQEITKYGLQYLAYLQDENGQLVINEENIQKVIEARTRQMAVTSALQYIQQLQTALDNDNVAALEDLLKATDMATESTWDFVYAQLAALKLNDEQYRAALQRINALRALTENAVHSIDETLKDTQETLDDILKYVEDMIKQEVENQIDALEKQIDDMKEIVDLQKKSLELERKKDTYTKSVAEKTAEIAKLQQQLALQELDTSRESQAKQIDLREQIAELQSDLDDEMADHAYDATSDALDDMYSAYEKEKNQEIKVLENSISSEEKLYQLAIERINSQWDSLYDDLIAWNTEYGTVINDEITAAWNNASRAVQEYGSYLEAVEAIQARIGSTSNNNSIDTDYNVVGETYYENGGYNQKTYEPKMVRVQDDWTAPSGLNEGDFVVTGGGIYRITSASGNGYSSELVESANYTTLEELDEYYRRKLAEFNNGKYVYHNGGEVRKDGLKSDEVPAILQEGEFVLTRGQKQELFRYVDESETLFAKMNGFVKMLDEQDIFSSMLQENIKREMQNTQNLVDNSDNRKISIQVPVQINTVQKLDASEIRQLTQDISDYTVEQLNESFVRRGKRNFRP